MLIAIPLQSASHYFSWSNRVYVTGSVLTLASAGMLLYEKRAKNSGKDAPWELASEIVVIIAALMSVLGSIGAITFGNLISHLKDVDLSNYQSQASLDIAKANQRAAEANQKAQEATGRAAAVERANLQLSGQVGDDARQARAAEAALQKASKATTEFAHALQTQHGEMLAQTKTAPVISPAQAANLGLMLRPFAGAKVQLHVTSDTVVQRLSSTLAFSLQQAGITPSPYSTDMGALYQGVSIAVHDPSSVPPVANALVLGLRQLGIDAHPVAAPQMVPEGEVGIFIGPN